MTGLGTSTLSAIAQQLSMHAPFPFLAFWCWASSSQAWPWAPPLDMPSQQFGLLTRHRSLTISCSAMQGVGAGPLRDRPGHRRLSHRVPRLHSGGGPGGQQRGAGAAVRGGFEVVGVGWSCTVVPCMV